MTYPDPCVECRGTSTHEMMCPAVLRGAGQCRDLCLSSPSDGARVFCEKPYGHQSPFCSAGTDITLIVGGDRIPVPTMKIWLFENGERLDTELVEPRDGIACERCGEYDEHARWCPS